jgi:hypothetical protein
LRLTVSGSVMCPGSKFPSFLYSDIFNNADFPLHAPCLLFYFILFFGSTGVWPQGLMIARQVLYHLKHNYQLFLC